MTVSASSARWKVGIPLYHLRPILQWTKWKSPPAGEEAANLRAQEAYSRDERLRSGIAANRFQERRRYGRKNISTDGCGVRKKRRKYRGGTRCASYTHATALSSRSEKRPSSRANRVTIRFILVDCVHPRAVMVKHPWWKYPAKNMERERERERFFLSFAREYLFHFIFFFFYTFQISFKGLTKCQSYWYLGSERTIS